MRPNLRSSGGARRTARVPRTTSLSAMVVSCFAFLTGRVTLQATSMNLVSVDRLMRQVTYDFAEHGLLHRFGCLFGREPLDLAMFLFWPLLALTRHFQWEDVHFTDQDVAVLKALFVGK